MNDITDSTDKLAAHSLLLKAMHTQTESLFNLLVESAHRLDNTINISHARLVWAENWIQQKQKERTHEHN